MTLEQFFSSLPKKTYSSGSIIIRSTDNPKSVYYLVSGYIRQQSISDKGELLYMHVFKPGACFPLTWILNHTPNRYVYEAVGKVQVSVAAESDVLRFISSQPDILIQMLKKILLGLDGMQSRMEMLVFGQAREALLGVLRYMAKSFGKKVQNTIEINLPLTHKDLASWIGTTRETVSLHMSQLKHEGILTSSKKKITILLPNALGRV